MSIRDHRRVPTHIVYRFTQSDRHANLQFTIHEIGNYAGGVQWNWNRAISPFWRLYYNDKPGSYVEFKGTQLKLLPNQVVVVPREADINLRGNIGTPHSWIHFSIEPKYLLNHHEPFELVIDSVQRSLISSLKHLTGMQSKDDSNTLQQMLAHNAACLVQYTFLKKPLNIRNELPKALITTLAYIQNSKFTHFSNKLLAQQAGMSVEGLIRLFKRNIGITPSVFVKQRRIHEACKLLTFTEDSIEEVAAKLGFMNRNHFSRLFSQAMKCGPAEFRKKAAVSSSTIIR